MQETFEGIAKSIDAAINEMIAKSAELMNVDDESHITIHVAENAKFPGLVRTYAMSYGEQHCLCDLRLGFIVGSFSFICESSPLTLIEAPLQAPEPQKPASNLILP